MARPNLRRRVRMMWNDARVGPTPDLGAKVVVWIPKEHRGLKGTVVANHQKAQGKAKTAPWDKYRVKIKPAGQVAYVVCSLEEMLPEGKTVKDVVG
jgi:hypothetical protein